MPSPVDNLPITTIIERARDARAQFEAIIDAFSTDEMLVAHAPVGWSVKDVLNHIAFWQFFAAKQFQLAAAGAVPEDIETITGVQLDETNAQVRAAGEEKSLDQVRAEFAQSHVDLLAAFDTIPADETDLWWQRWPKLYTPKRLIFYTTYDHYAEHQADLRAWLGESDA